MITNLYDKITGPCIREISFKGAPEKAVYLTFDDGPDQVCTPKVLEILKRYNAKATFFVIGENADKNHQIIEEIKEQGHAIGDHTINHDTSNYFKKKGSVRKWLNESSEFLEKYFNIQPVGFRSPLQIKTPALNQILKEKKRPLVLWDVRFYDTKYRLTVPVVENKLGDIKDGSIILLHDTHHGKRMDTFLIGLEHLVLWCKTNDYRCLPLTEELIQNSYLEKYETF